MMFSLLETSYKKIMLKSAIRRYVFWTLDFFRGSKIRKQYNSVKNIMEDTRSAQDAIFQFREDLLKHAVKTTPYYRKLGNTNFDEMPTVTKSFIKEHYDEFQSESYRNSKKHYMSTSGSTGTPFKVAQDMRKRQRVLAELIYFNERFQQKVGDKFCFFRVWTDLDKNNKLALFAKNMIPVDISSLDDENMEHIRQILKKDREINEIMGYASTHKQLLHYVNRCGDSPEEYHLGTILSGSEMLEPIIRKKLKKQFGCKVISRYSNQENGVLAQQCEDDEEYHVNTASYYIELFKLDVDEPVEIGEVGRVIVTDLFNYAMPMIRYDTGDLAVQSSQSVCGWNTMILENIQGRRVNACYDPKGRMLSPFLLDKFMEQFDELSQFQFIQEGKSEYILKVNGAKGKYEDKQFYKMLKDLLGEAANIKLEHVDDIPCCASGKFMQMICNYDREEN